MRTNPSGRPCPRFRHDARPREGAGITRGVLTFATMAAFAVGCGPSGQRAAPTGRGAPAAIEKPVPPLEAAASWVWGSAESDRCIPPDQKRIVDGVWRVGDGRGWKGWPAYRDSIISQIRFPTGTCRTASGTTVAPSDPACTDDGTSPGNLAANEDSRSPLLYMAQMHLQNLVSLAVDCGDAPLVDDLSAVALAAFPFLRAPDGTYVGQAPAAGPLTWGTFDEGRGHVVEELNAVTQWTYFVSSVLGAISLVPEGTRTPRMSECLEKYVPLLAALYQRLVFAEGRPDWGEEYAAPDPFGASLHAWTTDCVAASPHGTATHHDQVMRLKSERTYSPRLSYCNLVLDWDLQLAGGVVEWLAAVAREAALAGRYGAEAAGFAAHARNFARTFAGQMVRTELTAFDGRPVEGLVLAPGGWRDHPDFAYSDRDDLTNRPPRRDEGRVRPEVGGDLGHEVRVAWVLRTFYFHRDLIAGSFPVKADMEAFAGQLAYRVFDGNFQEPRFRNFMDGSNGWFRVWFDSRTVSIGPFDDGASFFNGYQFYARLNPDLSRLRARLWEILRASASPTTRETALRSAWFSIWSCDGYSDRSGWTGCRHTGDRESFDQAHSVMLMKFLAAGAF